MAVDGEDREDVEILLGRAPNLVLSTELLESVENSVASDWAIGQVAASTPPGNFTDDILRAAVENWNIFTKAGVEVSLTLKEVIRRAPSDLILSEETYNVVFESSSWVCQQVLQRWPSEYAITAGLQGEKQFEILMQLMPSIKISSAAIVSIRKDSNRRSRVHMVKAILDFQPETVVTEDMLLAVADSDSHYYCETELLHTLVQHEPHVHLTEEVLERVISSSRKDAIELLKVLSTRPRLEFNPVTLSLCIYDRLENFEEFKEKLSEALKRSKSFGLDEREMLDIMAECTPDSLGIVLSARPDAVAIERVIEQLVSKHNDTWEYAFESESFQLLLDRAGVSEAQRQSWILRFSDTRVQECDG
ncbi:hypothetical protein BO71DRAFT_435422 [Aspergillus ellipticus CBS 707.79]|uniref:Uncharacterized protein n=1 Tax=Aspergillus ellipticus CBS 707.79 TaxID=1448320 RepID=A0A319CU56_9EURO|nr:hypothetical protein BO71DRAFT_435422 [Aspergillus ellipticus CBS 707.79]